MADIQIQGPDGRMRAYPEGTPHEAILADMRTIYKPMRGATPPPRAGDPAIMNSPIISPRAQTIQPYKTDEDWQNVQEAMILGEKNRGVIQAIQNTPGRTQRMKEAEEVGKAQGKLSEMQRHGAANLRLLDQIRATFDEADDDSKTGAIGPHNTEKLKPEAPITVGGVPLPFLPSIPTTIEPQSGVPIMEPITVAKRNAIFAAASKRKLLDTIQKRGTQATDAEREGLSTAEKQLKAWDLQNRLLHDIEGLTTKFIMTSGGGVNMSDSRQKAFTDTIGAMLYATTPEQFHNIANDAENILRETFGITMPQAASAPGINPAAVQELMQDTSSRRRQQFDQIFGEGASEQVIRSMNARARRREAN